MIARTQTMSALSLTFGAFAIVAGGAVAFCLTRSITRQLGGEPAYAASIAGAIAAGDLTVQIAVDDERNQTSLMLRCARCSAAWRRWCNRCVPAPIRSRPRQARSPPAI
jgi:methyl-accepting chemotaxis protein